MSRNWLQDPPSGRSVVGRFSQSGFHRIISDQVRVRVFLKYTAAHTLKFAGSLAYWSPFIDEERSRGTSCAHCVRVAPAEVCVIFPGQGFPQVSFLNQPSSKCSRFFLRYEGKTQLVSTNPTTGGHHPKNWLFGQISPQYHYCLHRRSPTSSRLASTSALCLSSRTSQVTPSCLQEGNDALVKCTHCERKYPGGAGWPQNASRS